MPLPTNLAAGGFDVDTRDHYGVALILHPGDATYEIEIQRAPDSAGAPDTGAAITIAERLPASLPFFIDFLPDDSIVRWYRMRHTDDRGEDAGDWSAWQSAAPEPVSPEALTTNNAAQRVDAIAAADTSGVLAPTVRQRTTGYNAKRLTKGHHWGTGKNGDTITFPEPLAALSMIVVSGGIKYEPRSGQWTGGTYNAALPQYEQLEAVNASTTGFTLRGRLMQKGTRTARTHNFGASNNLDTIGETAALTLANAPSADDKYFVHCSISLTVTCSAGGVETWGELVLAVDVMTDGTNWVPRAMRVYSKADAVGGSGTTLSIAHEVIPVAVTGVDSTDQVRIRVVSLTVYGSPGTITCSIHGFDGTGDPDSGVTYETGTDVLATMTPDAQDWLTWHLLEGVA